ncbi:hypothetical protein BX600DRAFT_508022 [Xylariales sp. PMI_506]|nr:hypothetical protein BX600DRAFT_508022 [Xylariales sp. PMI_506]
MNPSQDLTQTLVESFNALADEVQNLNDRQVVLEHKLRYAHEQFQYLADKYAPTAPEISETLVNLQIPPELHNLSLASTNIVPLPKRKTDTKHQIALIIREGRRVASSLGDYSRSSHSTRDTLSRTTMTTTSTILEQDFTVEGKKGNLGCPFSNSASEEPEARGENEKQTPDHTPHSSKDPICAAMYEETTSRPAPSQDGVSKCPIRYMDQHSPEEIAHYLETHKHELPRSHEVCVRRYQRNEEHIRKLDAKYGNLVNMVEGLGRIHQPMLPEQDTRPQSDVEKASNQRVETWVDVVKQASVTDDPDVAPLEDDPADEEERQSHFDRPLKEVRLGESPSRPWGIPVPVFDTPSMREEQHGRPASPPPAPVPMHDLQTPEPKMTGKCPFDHTKMQSMGATPVMPKHDENSSERPGPYAPFAETHTFAPTTPAPPQIPPLTSGQPAFLNAADFSQPRSGGPPQMLFTGPVFIGYPMDQAIQFMQSLQRQQ